MATNWQHKQDIINTPNPNHGGKYGYIPHKVFFDEIEEKLDKKGYSIIDDRIMTTKNNQIIAGNYLIKGDDSEMYPAITFTNSLNKMRKAEIWGSSLVLVCRNGMTRGFSKYSRKHLGENALPDFRKHIEIVINDLDNEFEKLKINREELKTKEIDKKVINQLIGDMYIQESLLTETQLSLIKKESKESTDFKEMNAWSFYNWCTQALRDQNHALNYDKSHIRLHSYLADQFDLTGASHLFNKVI